MSLPLWAGKSLYDPTFMIEVHFPIQYSRRHHLESLQHDFGFQCRLLDWPHHPDCHLDPCLSRQPEWSICRPHRFDSHYRNWRWVHQGERFAYDC